MHFPTLQTPRLLLRKVVFPDLASLQKILQATHREATEAAAIQLIQKIDESFASQQGISWALSLNDELIGTCGYYRGFNNATGEIGYVMRPVFRRKGYMKEALQAIVAYGFEQLALTRVIAITMEDNVGSTFLLEGLGFLKTEEREGEFLTYEKYHPTHISPA